MALVGSILALPRSQEVFSKGGFVGGLAMTLSTLGLFVWFWSMGAFFSSIVQLELRIKSGFFRVALIYPPCYFVFFIATFQSSSRGLLGLILPLHVFAMVCMFYLLYFVSKSLVLAETSKQASFYDYAGPFFLLWFFPVGVWFIQPRINRLHAQPVSRQENISPQDVPHPLTAPNVRTVSNETEIQPATPLAYAGLWLRLAAALIDGFLISFPLLFLVVFSVLVVRLVSAGKGHDPAIGILVALLTIVFLVPWFYFSFLESSRWQATVGKNVLRLYVTDIEGRRLTRGRAMGRNLAKYLSNLTMGVGHLMCGFTTKKQALHDVLARCLVLRRPK